MYSFLPDDVKDTPDLFTEPQSLICYEKTVDSRYDSLLFGSGVPFSRENRRENHNRFYLEPLFSVADRHGVGRLRRSVRPTEIRQPRGVNQV